MTDKEQRYVLIAIPETDREETCPFYSVCDGIDDCGVLGFKYNTCKVCNAGVTREEAVERMAKAIYFKACGTMKNYAKCKKEYIPFAEAALDDLL